MPLVANNAASRLAASIGAADTTISLQIGTGSMFPQPQAGDWFPLTIIKPSGEYEIANCTARSDDVLTILRAREETGAKSFAAGDRVELRLTAETLLGIARDHVAAALPPGFGPVPWSLPSEPHGWIFADGRTLLEATPYQALRAAYIAADFPYGQDGSGNPKVPDCRGRVTAGVDSGAGRLTGGMLGNAMGAETHALTVAQMPSHGHSASASAIGNHTHSVSGTAASAGNHNHDITGIYSAGSTVQSGVNWSALGPTQDRPVRSTASDGAHTHSVSGTAAAAGSHTHTITVSNNGSGQAHNNVQPTLVTNMIVKT